MVNFDRLPFWQEGLTGSKCQRRHELNSLLLEPSFTLWLQRTNSLNRISFSVMAEGVTDGHLIRVLRKNHLGVVACPGGDHTTALSHNLPCPHPDLKGEIMRTHL